MVVALAEVQAQAQNVGSSLLLLIDASGSMAQPVGGGNSQAKIEAARDAATTALGRAARSGSVEVAVLAFSGDCANPVPRYQDFTTDVDRLSAFIAGPQPGGGTPMADALLFANRFMNRNGKAGARDRMIMLLADGQNDYGDVGQALATLQASGTIFRHETVGFGIMPNSPAAADLRDVATQTGGTYHHAADAAQLADVFMEFVDTFSVIDLLGQFGKNAQPTPRPHPPDADAGPQEDDDDGLTSLLGSFKVPQGDASLPAPTSYGATGDKDHYLAVATSPPTGWRIEPGEPGYFGFGWHTGSGHDAGMAAEAECRRQGGGSACDFNAGGTSMAGGCVGFAMAKLPPVSCEAVPPIAAPIATRSGLNPRRPTCRESLKLLPSAVNPAAANARPNRPPPRTLVMPPTVPCSAALSRNPSGLSPAANVPVKWLPRQPPIPENADAEIPERKARLERLSEACALQHRIREARGADHGYCRHGDPLLYREDHGTH